MNQLRAFIAFIKPRIIPVFTVMATLFGLRHLLTLPLPYIAIIIALAIIALGFWYIQYKKSLKEYTLQPVRELSFTPRHLIFAYGSLLIKDSILRSVSQNPGDLQCIPAILEDHRLTWGAVSKKDAFLGPDGKTPKDDLDWASLIVERSPNDRVNGAIIGLSHADYLSLLARESNYYPSDVTSKITLKDQDASLPNQKIEAFLPKTDEKAADISNQNPVYIRREYFNNVNKSLRALGFARIKNPKPLILRSATLASEIAGRTFASRQGQDILEELWKNLSTNIEIERDFNDTGYGLEPIIIPKKLYDKAVRSAEAIVALSAKAALLLRYFPELADLSDFVAAELADIERANARDELIPAIARIDMTYSANQLSIFEINSDSPGGMRHIDILSGIQSRTLQGHTEFDWISCEPTEIVDASIKAVVGNKSQGKYKRCAIIEADPSKWSTYPEMLHFKSELDKRGVPTDIVDVADRRFEVRYDGELHLNAQTYDLVYKRILWQDLHNHSPGCSLALQAADKAGTARVVNSLGSRLTSNKLLLSVISAPQFESWLDTVGVECPPHLLETVRSHLPQTLVWGKTPQTMHWKQQEDLFDKVIHDPYRFVLKSFHGYGGEEVVIGLNERNPVGKFRDLWHKKYILQPYIPHGRALRHVPGAAKLKQEYHAFILGAWVISGRCVGMEAKTSPRPPINMARGARRTAVFPTR